MSVPAHLQAMFDTFDRDRSVQMAFAGHMFNAVSEWRSSPWSRGLILENNGIADGSHDEVIAALRKILRLNVEATKEGRGFIPAKVWWLCGALIAEGRLRRSVKRIASNFAPQLQAAE